MCTGIPKLQESTEDCTSSSEVHVLFRTLLQNACTTQATQPAADGVNLGVVEIESYASNSCNNY